MHHLSRSVFISIALVLCSFTTKAQYSTSIGDMYDRPVDTLEHALIEQLKQRNLSWQFGASFLVIDAQDTLRRALKTVGSPGIGFGFEFTGSYYFDPVPFALGADVGFAFFGGDTKTYHSPVGPFTDTLSYQAQNTHIPVLLNARFQPNLFTWVFPFAEVIGGVTLMGSTLDVTRSNGLVQTTNTQSESSATWQYGVGCGIMVKLVDFVTVPTQLTRMLLNVRTRYLWGGNASVASFQINENMTTPVVQQPVPTADNFHFAVGIIGQF